MKRFCMILVFALLSVEAVSQEMSFTSIEPVPIIKRGREYEVNWLGGSREDAVSIVLVDKREREVVVESTTNTGKAAVRIPSRTRTGSYSIKIVNKTSGEATRSGQVRVKRRIPLVLQIAPLVVIPMTVLLLNSDQHPDEELPAMPGPI